MLYFFSSIIFEIERLLQRGPAPAFIVVLYRLLFHLVKIALVWRLATTFKGKCYKKQQFGRCKGKTKVQSVLVEKIGCLI